MAIGNTPALKKWVKSRGPADQREAARVAKEEAREAARNAAAAADKENGVGDGTLIHQWAECNQVWNNAYTVYRTAMHQIQEAIVTFGEEIVDTSKTCFQTLEAEVGILKQGNICLRLGTDLLKTNPQRKEVVIRVNRVMKENVRAFQKGVANRFRSCDFLRWREKGRRWIKEGRPLDRNGFFFEDGESFFKEGPEPPVTKTPPEQELLH